MYITYTSIITWCVIVCYKNTTCLVAIFWTLIIWTVLPIKSCVKELSILTFILLNYINKMIFKEMAKGIFFCRNKPWKVTTTPSDTYITFRGNLTKGFCQRMILCPILLHEVNFFFKPTVPWGGKKYIDISHKSCKNNMP